MRPGRQDLNVIFFTFRSCRPARGQQAPVAQARDDRGIVLKFFETAIYFWNFNFFKYKNEKTAVCEGGAEPMLWDEPNSQLIGEKWAGWTFLSWILTWDYCSFLKKKCQHCKYGPCKDLVLSESSSEKGEFQELVSD